MAMMNEMEYRTIGKALAGGYRAAVYCRLSKDDDLQGESASIANQRDMLEKYCEKQGWEVVAVYQDDGFTGLNMERPDCALPGFVDSKNEEKTERNAGYLVVSHSGGGMLRQGTRKGIRRTPANRGMRAHRIVKSLDISEDVCHGLWP